jgi:DNA polymerase (family X)
MRNSEISRILDIISIYEEMSDGGFKARAYEKASRIVDSLTTELSDIYSKGGVEAVMEIPGIGEGISKKIVDLLKTGKTEHLEELKRKIPIDVEEISKIEGIGPKKMKALWENLKIRNVSDLEQAAKNHTIQKIRGFGKKSEQDILRSIEFYKKHSGRFLLGKTFPLLEEICGRLEKVPGVQKAVIAGSARRMRETIGDGDFLVASTDPARVMDFFSTMPEVVHVYSRGKAKVLAKLENGLDIDLEVVEKQSFGSALQYFTGNKEHNVKLRTIANTRGWKLNEYGVFENEKYLFGDTEEKIYERLGMNWIPPELRENMGEIELAQGGKLPNLIQYNSLKGDVQMHSTWSDGVNTICEMANGARDFGLEYIAITDHSKRVTVAHGLAEKDVEKQGMEIDQINSELRDVTVLKGIEVDILEDGTLDLPDSILAKLDVVGASIHSHFNLTKADQTKRIISAIKNPNVDIFFHPTGRLLQQRDAYEFDLEEVFDAAKESGTILEIDASPPRLDLRDEQIRLAHRRGCEFVIDSDAHSSTEFEYLRYGIGQARRGWLEKKDVLNTMRLDLFLSKLKGH